MTLEPRSQGCRAAQGDEGPWLALPKAEGSSQAQLQPQQKQHSCLGFWEQGDQPQDWTSFLCLHWQRGQASTSPTAEAELSLLLEVAAAPTS
ncbi:hypothetical protein Y1Q_0000386 [Alligator mississippiensis]|uniref:Uncharacterized protein n=1 Tax=Alligator mississippiensis TaxID=8496 RepID=A0A151N6V6_ALLMI|nr:hypothetical protein Y1Q_0000386 [Alligator mississippiensis]